MLLQLGEGAVAVGYLILLRLVHLGVRRRQPGVRVRVRVGSTAVTSATMLSQRSAGHKAVALGIQAARALLSRPELSARLGFPFRCGVWLHGLLRAGGTVTTLPHPSGSKTGSQPKSVCARVRFRVRVPAKVGLR